MAVTLNSANLSQQNSKIKEATKEFEKQQMFLYAHHEKETRKQIVQSQIDLYPSKSMGLEGWQLCLGVY